LRVAVLCLAGKCADADATIYVGSDPYEIAKNLYDALRRLDKTKVDIALVPTMAERGIGLAVMNRLRKASGFKLAKNEAELRGLLGR